MMVREWLCLQALMDDGQGTVMFIGSFG
jgi:hypothetical protein